MLVGAPHRPFLFFFTKIFYTIYWFIKWFFQGILYQPHEHSLIHSSVGTFNLDYPVVFLHGLLIFGNDNNSIYCYSHVYTDLIKKLFNIDIYAPTLPNIGDWQSRTIEAFVFIHAKHPNWNIDSPIHLISHSLGTLTSMKMKECLQNPNDVCIDADIFIDTINKYRKYFGDKYYLLINGIVGKKITMRHILDVIFGKGRWGPKMIISVVNITPIYQNVKLLEYESNKFSYVFIGTILIRLYTYILPQLITIMYNFGYSADDFNLYTLFDCFRWKNNITKGKTAFTDLIQTESIYKNTEIYDDCFYLTLAYSKSKNFSPEIFLTNLFNTFYGIVNTDGILKVEDQLNFKNYEKVHISKYNENNGVHYYAIENGDHLDCLMPQNIQHFKKMYSRVLYYLSNSEKKFVKSCFRKI